MKTILSILILVTLTFSVGAQQIAGPNRQNALTVSTAFLVPGSSTTNIPSTLAPVFIPGRDGIGLSFYLNGTNAATTTNMTVVLEPIAYTGSGIAAVGVITYSVILAQNGTTATLYYTNIAPTTANLFNAPGLRIKSIQNTNLASLFISNVTAYARP